MLTDIFAYRYEQTPIWKSFGEPERRLLVQGFRIINEQVFPAEFYPGKKDTSVESIWTDIHNKLSMELGLSELAPMYSFYPQNPKTGVAPAFKNGIQNRCEKFVCAEYDPNIPPDGFIKERISFIEIAFREKEAFVKAHNEELPSSLRKAEIEEKKPKSNFLRVPGSRVEAIKAINDKLNKEFKVSVEELNERLRRSGCGLHYHNGFIQLSTDNLVLKEIESPFWELVDDEKWENVDTDIKEAIDRRDSGVKDPAFYAARALESTIKIISETKGWTLGKEKGAHSYIDNLCNKKRGGDLIDEWEKESLKHFFTSVRNPLGHGPGSEKMRELTPLQTNWAIESSMIWIKSLIKRF